MNTRKLVNRIYIITIQNNENQSKWFKYCLQKHLFQQLFIHIIAGIFSWKKSETRSSLCSSHFLHVLYSASFWINKRFSGNNLASLVNVSCQETNLMYYLSTLFRIFQSRKIIHTCLLILLHQEFISHCSSIFKKYTCSPLFALIVVIV